MDFDPGNALLAFENFSHFDANLSSVGTVASSRSFRSKFNFFDLFVFLKLRKNKGEKVSFSRHSQSYDSIPCGNSQILSTDELLALISFLSIAVWFLVVWVFLDEL